MGQFRPLTLSTLRSQTGYSKPYFSSPNLVKVTSSALEVMTDLHFIPAATVLGELDLESASQKMIARGVRSLLVVDSSQDVLGIITARDVMGDRPSLAMAERRVVFSEIRVCDVMTPAALVEVLPLDDVLHAHVGDVIETLKHSGRQHALVVEMDPIVHRPMIRGIFSASQVARQLGIALQTHELSQTFAEIDRAISTSK